MSIKKIIFLAFVGLSSFAFLAENSPNQPLIVVENVKTLETEIKKKKLFVLSLVIGLFYGSNFVLNPNQFPLSINNEIFCEIQKRGVSIAKLQASFPSLSMLVEVQEFTYIDKISGFIKWMFRLFLTIWFPCERNEVVANIEKALTRPVSGERLFEEMEGKFTEISLLIDRLGPNFSETAKQWIEEFYLLKKGFDEVSGIAQDLLIGGKVD